MAKSADFFNLMKNLSIFTFCSFFLVIVFFLLDFMSKKIVLNILKIDQFISIGSFVKIKRIENFGIAFGLFSEQESKTKWIFFCLSCFFSFFVFLSFLFFFYKSRNIFSFFSCVFIISGSLGNLIDRLIRGSVLDFICFCSDNFCLTFNLADIEIFSGILSLIAHYLIKSNRNIKKNIDTYEKSHVEK